MRKLAPLILMMFGIIAPLDLVGRLQRNFETVIVCGLAVFVVLSVRFSPQRSPTLKGRFFVPVIFGGICISTVLSIPDAASGALVLSLGAIGGWYLCLLYTSPSPRDS